MLNLRAAGGAEGVRDGRGATGAGMTEAALRSAETARIVDRAEVAGVPGTRGDAGNAGGTATGLTAATLGKVYGRAGVTEVGVALTLSRKMDDDRRELSPASTVGAGGDSAAFSATGALGEGTTNDVERRGCPVAFPLGLYAIDHQLSGANSSSSGAGTGAAEAAKELKYTKDGRPAPEASTSR
jgi:hypothetical protein